MWSTRPASLLSSRLPTAQWLCFLGGLLGFLEFSLGQGEEPPTRSSEEVYESIRKGPKDLEQLRRDLEELKAAKKRESATERLAEETFLLIRQDRFLEARQLLSEWKKIYPQDSRIPKIKELLGRLETESDLNAQAELKTLVLAAILKTPTARWEASTGGETPTGGEMPTGGETPTGRETSTGGEASTDLEQRLKSQLKMRAEANHQNRGEANHRLCAASSRGDFTAVLELLVKGADPNARDRLEVSALEHAAKGGYADVVRLLLAHGADPNRKGRLGMTALMVAAAHGKLEAAKTFIEAGADPNAVNDAGATALFLAEEHGHWEVVECLRQELLRRARAEEKAARAGEPDRAGRGARPGGQGSQTGRAGEPDRRGTASDMALANERLVLEERGSFVYRNR